MEPVAPQLLAEQHDRGSSRYAAFRGLEKAPKLRPLQTINAKEITSDEEQQVRVGVVLQAAGRYRPGSH